MKKKYEINYLSEDFFEKYDSKHFPEIEHKLNRPYLVLVLKVENNTYAIPLEQMYHIKLAIVLKIHQEILIVLLVLIIQKLL